MKLVYRHDNPALVGLAKGLLEDAGLEVTVKNEFGGSGFPPYNQVQELWILNEQDFETASETLAVMNEKEMNAN